MQLFKTPRKDWAQRCNVAAAARPQELQRVSAVQRISIISFPLSSYDRSIIAEENSADLNIDGFYEIDLFDCFHLKRFFRQKIVRNLLSIKLEQSPHTVATAPAAARAAASLSS